MESFFCDIIIYNVGGGKMICPKCKYEIKGKLSICPRCGASLVERKVTKSVKTVKGTKSKINVQDQSSLVGGTVGRGDIISLKKKPRKKEISIKDFNSVADYKDAKEKLSEQINQNPFEGVNTFNNKRKPINIYSNQDLFKKIDYNTGINNEKNVETNVNFEGRQGRFFSTQSSNNIVNQDIKTVKKATSLFSITKNNEPITYKTKENKNVRTQGKVGLFNVLAYCIVIGLWVFALWTLYSATRETYYFSEEESNNEILTNTESPVIDEEMSKYNGVSKSGQVGGSSGEGITSIVYDNQYIQQLTLKSESELNKLIAADSLKQKNNCPADVKKIENEIINNYGIVAVNLCEMDYDFALELRNVVKYIYNNYPQARNYLTNLTLANVGNDSSFIAAFMPVFSFATSKTNSGYPVGIKTQILLNAKYFLNSSKLKGSVSYAEKSGYFPANATRSSTVAHEFGHYLSYVALLNYYNSSKLNFVKASQAAILYEVYNDFNEGDFSYKLLQEAYSEYVKLYSNDSFDDFRSSISGYAMAKDNSGNYIYDETIAEAFHDVYINGDLAKPASNYIVKVLISKL